MSLPNVLAAGYARDLTENVEQLQVRDRVVAALARLSQLAAANTDLVMVGRSHDVAAQATTLGKRFASCAEELLLAITDAGLAAKLDEFRAAGAR